jgi:tRNA(Ile)-lysidine synthase
MKAVVQRSDDRAHLDASAVSADEFAALIARCGPFEASPRIAVAVSGGSDSMALALLAADWARAQGGEIVALTVDHGLRPESAAEAAQVGRWLAARGLAHRVLAWIGAKPATGIQEAAREARRALLLAACRARGIFHLLLAHQQDDQRETAAMRAARGSGPDGRAAMSLVVETAHVRLLRPLLAVPRARLIATLEARGQVWIDDPSNRDMRFLRARLRRADAGAAIDPAALARMGAERAAREAQLAAALARHVAIHPEGWATVDPALFATEFGARALARLVATIGGGAYPPRNERVARAHAALAAAPLARARTLGGCRLVPWRGAVLVVREAGVIAERMPLPLSREETIWDNRFTLRAEAPLGGSLTVAALGAAGWAEIARAAPSLRSSAVPAAVRPSLPALWDLDGVCAVPHLFYRRRDQGADRFSAAFVRFRPRHALADAGFLAV